jgi:hypothetical protein
MAGNERGLIGYWSFNEGSGDTVHDWSRNAMYHIIKRREIKLDLILKDMVRYMVILFGLMPI